MPDREKVIKGLECHKIDNNHRINCADCPYYVDDDNHIRCVNNLHDDALLLLKEQEPKPAGKEWNECPSCGKVLDRIHDMHYCGVCGQAVKWDG